jgi:hypothetical protein
MKKKVAISTFLGVKHKKTHGRGNIYTVENRGV